MEKNLGGEKLSWRKTFEGKPFVPAFSWWSLKRKMLNNGQLGWQTFQGTENGKTFVGENLRGEVFSRIWRIPRFVYSKVYPFRVVYTVHTTSGTGSGHFVTTPTPVYYMILVIESLHIYIYVYTYICIYMYIRIYEYMYIRIYVYTYTRIYVCSYIFIYVYM